LVGQAPVGRLARDETAPIPSSLPSPAFRVHGYRFPPEVITLAVRWYPRFGLSYRDVEELVRQSRSTELEERPGHGPDARFLCPTGIRTRDPHLGKIAGTVPLACVDSQIWP
jgi:hypothetical protein